MSSDSKTQSGAQQPPLAQLWPDFGTATSNLTSENPSSTTSLSSINNNKTTHKNKNYVDFNQFIMQHNLVSPPASATSSTGDKGAAPSFEAQKNSNQDSNYNNNGDVFSSIYSSSFNANQHNFNVSTSYNNNNVLQF